MLARGVPACGAVSDAAGRRVLQKPAAACIRVRVRRVRVRVRVRVKVRVRVRSLTCIGLPPLEPATRPAVASAGRGESTQHALVRVRVMVRVRVLEGLGL